MAAEALVGNQQLHGRKRRWRLASVRYCQQQRQRRERRQRWLWWENRAALLLRLLAAALHASPSIGEKRRDRPSAFSTGTVVKLKLL